MSTAVIQQAIVGDQASFAGKMKGKDLTILGRFEGDLELKGRLRIGREGSVRAVVVAADVEVEGEFEGEIRADRLAFGESARATGVFQAERFSMKEGAQVDGAVNLAPAATGAAEPPHAPAPAKTAKVAPIPPQAKTAPDAGTAAAEAPQGEAAPTTDSPAGEADAAPPTAVAS